MWTYCEFNAHLLLLLDKAAGQACLNLLMGMFHCVTNAAKADNSFR